MTTGTDITAVQAAIQMAEFAAHTLREQQEFEERVLRNPTAMRMLEESATADGIPAHTLADWALHGKEGLRAICDLFTARLIEDASNRDVAPTKGFKATTRGRALLLQDHPRNE